MIWFVLDVPNIRNLKSVMTKWVVEQTLVEQTLSVVWAAQKCESNPGWEVKKDGESMADMIVNKWAWTRQVRESPRRKL